MNQKKYDWLSFLGYSGALNDKLRGIYRAFEVEEGSLQDMEKSFLLREGIPSQAIQDMWKEYFETKNYPWEPSLYLDFVSNEVLDPRITFSRASTGTRINASGVLESVAIDGPRFDYDPVTLAPRGLLIEEQRSNLLLDSSALATGWTRGSAATFTNNAALAPDGTMTATGIVGLFGLTLSGAAGSLYRTGAAIAASTTYTLSLYVRAQSGTVSNVVLRMAETGGTVPSTVSSPFTVTTAWQRISLTITSNSGATALAVLLGTSSGAADVFVWGAQLEAGAFPTSYIPTTTAAATRAADVAVMTGANFSSWYRQDEGTLFAEGDTAGGTTPCFVSIDDGTTANRIQLRRGAIAPTTASFRMVSPGGSIDATLTTVSTTAFKQAAAIKAADQSAAANGGLFTFSAIANMPVVTQAVLGNGGGSTPLNGHIRKIAYFPRRLSNAELQGITS